MLAHRRLPVCLSFLSTDLPILQTVETSATLYQKDREKFHLLLTQEDYPQSLKEDSPSSAPKNRLIWLEISPYRVVMTMQGNGLLNYRHFWEKGVYGTSRYWLKSNSATESNFQATSTSYQQDCLRLRNFTRSLELEGHPLPAHLRVEYELWSDKLRLGHYILDLEIHH